MSAAARDSYTPQGRDELVFLPLGGTGEIGMNLNLYGHAGKWLMIDCGVTFADDATPGVDVIMPDPAFIAERRRDIAGLVLTHGHEDHIGAVPYLWPQLRCPVYATPFTAALVRRKLAEAGIEDDVSLTEVPMSGRFTVGPFELELITLTHSIPEPNAVVIRTAAGTVLHTGDWKLDPNPLIGDTADEAALRRLGGEGVLAMICDSTNALVEGESGSEEAVRASLRELVGRYEHRVAVACFASNVVRVRTIAEIAAHHGRHPALVGRSLGRIVEAARECGIHLPEFMGEQEAATLPRDRVLLICTGSQGEPRAALARIARDDHPNITLEGGDAVIFSSRIIPGNERSIGRLQNMLATRGIVVVTERDHFVHVSGHPARDELIRMYQWVRPTIAVPTHGEARHMIGHAELARACQVPQTVVIANGDLLRLSGRHAEVVGQVHHGRLAVDGTRLVSLDGETMRRRQRMLWNGSALLTLVMDEDGRLVADPQLSAPGLIEDAAADGEVLEDIVDAVIDAVESLPRSLRRDDEEVREAARRAVRRGFRARWGKRPPTDVHLVRL